MKHILLVLLAACTTTTTTQPAVYDFANRRLDEPSVLGKGESPKSQIRNAIARVQPGLLACADATPHRAGTIAIDLTIAGGTVVDAEVDAGGALAACMSDALMAIEVSMSESAVWQVHYPVDVDAR